MQIKLTFIRLCTKPRFYHEAQSNSKMAYCFSLCAKLFLLQDFVDPSLAETCVTYIWVQEQGLQR